MRKFGLIAGTEEIDLTTQTLFFYQPDGLGYEQNLSYRRVGRKWILLDRYEEQGEISGTLIFMGKNPYSQYKSFTYKTHRTNLKLTYTMDNGTTMYYRDVIISSIGKTELNLGGYLECPITFKASTPWYTELTYITKPTSMTNNHGWVWETYSTWAGSTADQTAGIQFKSVPDMTISIDIKTRIASPCALLIRGPISSPIWTHSHGGKEIATGRINYTIPANHFLVVDNRTAPYSIKIFGERSDGAVDYDNEVANVYAESDFSTDRFLELRNGTNTIEVVSSKPEELSNKILVGVEANIYHATV